MKRRVPVRNAELLQVIGTKRRRRVPLTKADDLSKTTAHVFGKGRRRVPFTNAEDLSKTAAHVVGKRRRLVPLSEPTVFGLRYPSSDCFTSKMDPTIGASSMWITNKGFGMPFVKHTERCSTRSSPSFIDWLWVESRIG